MQHGSISRDSGSAPTKQHLRAEVRARRGGMGDAERQTAATALTSHLIELVTSLGARSLASYSSMPQEPATGPFNEWALSEGIEVLLPVSLPDSQLGWTRHNGGESVVGRHGITEPAGPVEDAAALDRCDLLLIPACAYSPTGMRLGWGMGYYDRCLARLGGGTPVYAVVFDDDVYPELPSDPHDVPVTGAVTPAGVRLAKQ